jgi:hypothetical protein
MMYLLVLVFTFGSLLAGLPGQQDGNILLDDDFATRAYRWSLTHTAKISVDYADEALHMEITSPGQAILSVPDTSLDLSDYHLTVSAEIIDSTERGTVGVVFNYQDEDNYYVVEVTSAGDYSVSLVEHAQKTILVEGQLEGADRYQFDITAQENMFIIQINDTDEPIILQDETHKSGIVGLYGRAGRGSLHVAFDDLLLVDVLDD